MCSTLEHPALSSSANPAFRLSRFSASVFHLPRIHIARLRPVRSKLSTNACCDQLRTVSSLLPPGRLDSRARCRQSPSGAPWQPLPASLYPHRYISSYTVPPSTLIEISPHPLGVEALRRLHLSASAPGPILPSTAQGPTMISDDLPRFHRPDGVPTVEIMRKAGQAACSEMLAAARRRTEGM